MKVAGEPGRVEGHTADPSHQRGGDGLSRLGDKAGCERARERRLPSRDRLERGRHLFGRHRLEQVSVDAGSDRCHQLTVSDRIAQHGDPHRRDSLPDLLERDVVQRHVTVEHAQRRPAPQRQPCRVGPVLRLAYHGHSVELEATTDLGRGRLVAVCDDDGHHRLLIFPCPTSIARSPAFVESWWPPDPGHRPGSILLIPPHCGASRGRRRGIWRSSRMPGTPPTPTTRLQPPQPRRPYPHPRAPWS